MTDFDFQPSVTAPFRFQPTLDGSIYLATVTWNIRRQDWYLQLQDQTGAVIFTKPLVPSEVGAQIGAASWDFNSQTVTITTAQPHGYAIAQTVNLTISGMTPAAYNGTVQCFVTSATEVEYPLATDPGAATGFGLLSYDNNLAANFFTTSTLVWRQANNVFEVTP